MWPVLRHCPLVPYVPLPTSGSANVSALNDERLATSKKHLRFAH